MTEDPRITAYFAPGSRWREELALLRRILLDAGLTEEWKWRGPCYTLGGGNVAMLPAMKESVGLSFFKGAILSDPEGRLRAPGENSRHVRMFRFTSAAEIEAAHEHIAATVREAVANERAGRRVDPPPVEPAYPDELEKAFDADPAFRAAFEALTPGRRRGWILHFAGAKQSATRTGRVAKARSRILAGKGMHDR